MASWEFGGRRRRRRRRSSGDGGDAEALLDEAAVRFDFSEYTDINDMVDVNGGWGPLAHVLTAHTVQEFTADGLHLSGRDLSPPDQAALRIEGLVSPAIPATDGLTVLYVNHLNAITPDVAINFNHTLYGDGNDLGAPFVNGKWETSTGQEDVAGVRLYDLEPGYAAIVNTQNAQTGTISDSAIGVYVYIVVYDVPAEEARLRFVTPVGDFAASYPFAQTPLFAATPRVIDTLYYNCAANAEDETLDEYDIWNRALTPAEVDTLVAHFMA